MFHDSPRSGKIFLVDFNKDGIEDIFVKGWVRSIGGTLGFGTTRILTRYSNSHLIEQTKM